MESEIDRERAESIERIEALKKTFPSAGFAETNIEGEIGIDDIMDLNTVYSKKLKETSNSSPLVVGGKRERTERDKMRDRDHLILIQNPINPMKQQLRTQDRQKEFAINNKLHQLAN